MTCSQKATKSETNVNKLTVNSSQTRELTSAFRLDNRHNGVGSDTHYQ